MTSLYDKSGHAAILHSEFRMSKDIDLTLGLDISELEKIKEYLKEIIKIILR